MFQTLLLLPHVDVGTAEKLFKCVIPCQFSTVTWLQT